MIEFKSIFFLFIFYSFVGWCVEVVRTLFIEKKFINRGFLIGPYCPIYGVGCILITLLLKNDINDFASMFLKAVLICSVLEYATSYLMEKMFNYRWWDYSKRKFNINGRICLETTIPFGLGACLIMYFVNPIIFKIILNMNVTLSYILLFILLILFVADIIVSISIILKIKGVEKNAVMDSTEQLKEQIKATIKNNFHFYKRIFISFPDLKIKKQKK